MFQTVHYHLTSKKIETPFRFVLLADLHNQVYGRDNDLLIKEIERQKPDFICLAGDMLVGHSGISYDPAQKLIKNLAGVYPVFYGLGNHEARMRLDLPIYGTQYQEYMDPIREAGVRVLTDENRLFAVGKNKVRIYGYDLPMCYFEKFNRYEFSEELLERTLGECDRSGDVYTILLAHNPVYFPQYAAWGADLTLSGHLHGGIIRIPGLGGVITPQARLFPKYCAGKYKIDENYLVVSRGLGTHTIPIRINNRPELSVIHLAPEEAKTEN